MSHSALRGALTCSWWSHSARFGICVLTLKSWHVAEEHRDNSHLMLCVATRFTHNGFHTGCGAYRKGTYVFPTNWYDLPDPVASPIVSLNSFVAGWSAPGLAYKIILYHNCSSFFQKLMPVRGTDCQWCVANHRLCSKRNNLRGCGYGCVRLVVLTIWARSSLLRMWRMSVMPLIIKKTFGGPVKMIWSLCLFPFSKA